MIVECKPHNQVNVRMDGSRNVSLRNRQFVRKINVPMPVSAVRPSQFSDAQSDEVDDVPHHDEGSGVVDHGEPEQLLDSTDQAGTDDNDGGFLADDQVTSQERVEIGEGGGRVADGAVDQPPVVRSRRTRKPNSKYDPAIFDLDSIEIRGIPLNGKKNGWKGIYWPK